MNKEDFVLQDRGMKKKFCTKHGEYESQVMYSPLFSQVIETKCPKCIDEIEDIQKQNEQEAQFRGIGIPRTFIHESLYTFKDLDPSCVHAKKVAERYCVSTKRGRNLIISGPTGSGKTHLAIGIIKSIESRKKGYYTLNEILDEVKSTYSKTRGYTEERKDSIIRRYASIPYLIIDEFEEFNSTQDNRKIIGDILTARYNNDVQTILVCMLKDNQKIGKSELKDKIGEKVYRKLYERGASIVLGNWYENQYSLDI